MTHLYNVGSTGEEAAIIGSAFALQLQGWILPCYRELGAALVRGFSLFQLLCQFLGNAEDLVKGRQMPNHYGSRQLRFVSISSPVGTQIPQAVGMALAARHQGRGEVVLTYFGERATSEGDFHVALNFAGVFKAPVIFPCRNNQWGISTPFELQTAAPTVAVKACSYGIDGIQADGNGIFAVYSATSQAVEKVMNLSLSLDHRVVDGLVGAQFIHYVVPYLENPGLLALSRV